MAGLRAHVPGNGGRRPHDGCRVRRRHGEAAISRLTDAHPERSSGPYRLCSCDRSPLHEALFASATGRPNRSYRMGTTTMFRAVELNKPNMMTVAMGA